MVKREELLPGLTFFAVQDKKFKHNRMTVRLMLPLEKESAAKRAIVPFLLRKGCRSLPDFTQLNQQLCRLYGASLSCDVTKLSGNQVLALSIISIDDKYALEGEALTAACAKLLMEVLLEPALTPEGVFPEKEVELEKQQLLDAIESALNDKRTYALKRCREEVCRDTPLALDKYGDQASVRAVTPENAAEAYGDVLEKAEIVLSFVGCGDPTPARDVFAKALAGRSRYPIAPWNRRLLPREGAVREATQAMDVNQGKLVLGFRTKPWQTIREQMAYRLMSALYGGTPNSRLFVYVREKKSLCYYCASRYEKLTGLMFVDSGVEFAKRQETQEEILRQLAVVQEGKFTPEEFSAAQLYLQNALTAVRDSLGAIESWYFTQGFQEVDLTPEQEREILLQVTPEQAVQAAKGVQLDTVYFLTGKEER